MTLILANVLFIVGFVLCASMTHFKERKKILFLNGLSFYLYSFYLYCMGADSGLIVCLIAGTGSFFQMMISEKASKDTFWLRNGTALLFAAIGIAFCFRGPSDLFPVGALLIGRLAEAQAAPQHMRFGFVLSFSCWVLYAFHEGLLTMFCTEALILLSNLIAIWRHERISQKDVRVAMQAA